MISNIAGCISFSYLRRYYDYRTLSCTFVCLFSLFVADDTTSTQVHYCLHLIIIKQNFRQPKSEIGQPVQPIDPLPATLPQKTPTWVISSNTSTSASETVARAVEWNYLNQLGRIVGSNFFRSPPRIFMWEAMQDIEQHNLRLPRGIHQVVFHKFTHHSSPGSAFP